MKKTAVTICASATFYEEVVRLQDILEKMGYKVFIPHAAQKMKEAGTYQLEGFKPPLGDVEWKASLMHGHFDEVSKGDVCLVINNEKHGVPNYIGGNVLMEMALAFHERIPIVLYNKIPSESVFLEELLGMQPIELHGQIENLPKELAKLKA